MAVHERSLGPLYVARVRVVPVRVPIHRAVIIQMHEPWRRGQAVIVPGGRNIGFVLGWWTRTIEQDIEDDFSDSRWFSPKWLDNSVDDIATWKKAHHEDAPKQGPET